MEYDNNNDVFESDIPDNQTNNNESESPVTPPNAGSDVTETGSYEYGISYSSNLSSDNSQSFEPSKPHKSGGDKRKTAVIIAMALAFVLMLNIFSAFLGAKFAGYHKLPVDNDNNPQVTEGEKQSSINILFETVERQSIDPIVGSSSDSNLTKKQVYALVCDTVVEIRTETVVSGSVFGQYVSSGAGSGVIVAVQEGTDNYFLITNNHVISGATKISVRLNDGTEYDAKLVATDEETDIAVVTINSKKELKCAKFGHSDALVVGEEVVAIGNPLGELGGSLTDGIISALERDVIVGGISMKLLQTNVAVNPGNSGGGLFNMAGELIGIVNAKYSDEAVEGLAFAIPTETARDVMGQLIVNGYVKGRVSLGISLREITYWGRTYVVIGSDNKNTEFKENEQICKIDNVEVSSLSDIRSALRGKKIGDKVKVTVYRNRSYVEIEIQLVEYIPADKASASSGVANN